MRILSGVLATLVLVAAVGCKAPPPPAPVQEPVSPSALATITADYQKMDPSIRVGLVQAVRPEVNLVAVEGIAVAGIRTGTVVTIVGVSGNTHSPIAHGEVTLIDGQYLVVKFAPAQGALRGPMKGDMAVVFARN